jgi:type IX secretion system PorP/SprF family membrane protein
MKNIKLILIVVLFSATMFAQETTPNFLSYKYNMNMLNPAYAGVDGKQEVNLGFRKESLGLQDDPVTQFLSYSRGLNKNLGIGLSVINDKTFINKETNIAVDVSYKLQLNETTDFYFGMKAGGSMYTIDFASLGVNDPIYGANVSTFNPMVGVGAHLEGERYYFDVSVPNVLLSDVQKPVLDDMGEYTESVTEKLHLYLGTGYRFSISENFDITPSVFTRIVSDQDALIDLSATADISKIVEAGVTYRVGTSFIGSVLLKIIDNTQFGYAYESVTSDFSTISTGTHEFILRFSFD